MKFFLSCFLASFILFVPAKIFLLVNHINSSPIKIKNINGTVWNASFNLVLTNDSSVINFLDCEYYKWSLSKLIFLNKIKLSTRCAQNNRALLTVEGNFEKVKIKFNKISFDNSKLSFLLPSPFNSIKFDGVTNIDFPEINLNIDENKLTLNDKNISIIVTNLSTNLFLQILAHIK